MKKFIALFMVVLSLFVLYGVLYAGMDYIPHVIIDNIMRVSGSSANVKLAYGHSMSDPEVENIQGFDTKKPIQDYIQGVNNANQNNSSTDSEKFGFYEKLDDKAWADMKFRGMLTSGSVALLPGKKRVSKTIAANTVPTSKTGLLNPGKPVTITAFDNKIILRFEENRGSYNIRLLDDKGKELGEIKSSRKDRGPIEITLSQVAKNYYLEFDDGYGYEKKYKYCYILLKIEPDIMPKEDIEVTKKIKEAEAFGEKIAVIEDKYDSKRVDGALTKEDERAMTDEIMEVQMSEEPEDAKQFARSMSQTMYDYMDQHNIESISDLTDKDMESMQSVMQKKVIASWPPFVKNIANKYMKEHNIKRYEDLQQKDMEAIAKLVEKQASGKRGKRR